MATDSTTITQEQQELAGQYLTFRLQQELYGVDILKVLEIISVPVITDVPKSPATIKGVINLRGRIIAVLDLRQKFSMPPIDIDRESCIIILDLAEVNGGQIGILVDRVSEVIDIEAEEIDTTINTQDQSAQAIKALAKNEQGITILLNIDELES